jgi:dinuclear metal center YbgI/SA1388 family protein
MKPILVDDILQALEAQAPFAYQEKYDNAGLLIGDKLMVATGILIALDCTESIIDEAISLQYNVIVCHHPIIFTGLKKLTGNNYVEKIVIKAIKNNIAIIASHTNLDNMADGVNAKMAEKLGLKNCKILAPSADTIRKLVMYVPASVAEEVQQGMFETGAGHIGQYANCSFSSVGIGSFKALVGSHPVIGSAGGAQESVNEVKLEMIYHKHLETSILNKINSYNYYEEKAYEIFEIKNLNQSIGAGLIGDLPEALDQQSFLKTVKTTFAADCVRFTSSTKTKFQKIALCGGAGSFLLRHAIQSGADAFISADFKYHEFFDAEGKLMIADIGHYESEQYTSEIFYAYLQEKFTNFAIQITGCNTNPVKYF